MLAFLDEQERSGVRENLEKIRERIARVAARTGRSAGEITLVGVSKTFPAERILEAHAAGVRHFGENRVQEWEGKREKAGHLAATWHLIGHVQSNKAARAARIFDSVDSVDDAVVADRLDRARAESGEARRLRVLLEVRLAPEESKSGVAPEALEPLAAKILRLPRLELQGLMCIPPFAENPAGARKYFARLRSLRDDLAGQIGLELPVLSMGMSHDFEVAIEEGATEVRVGTLLFGQREAMQP